jgi:hypothetical protein
MDQIGLMEDRDHSANPSPFAAMENAHRASRRGMATQRNYEAILTQAELLAMPPEGVCSFLKTQAVQSETEVLTDDFDKVAELALVERNDPLINLALARYAGNSETVKALFDAGEPAQAMRLVL